MLQQKLPSDKRKIMSTSHCLHPSTPHSKDKDTAFSKQCFVKILNSRIYKCSKLQCAMFLSTTNQRPTQPPPRASALPQQNDRLPVRRFTEKELEKCNNCRDTYNYPLFCLIVILSWYFFKLLQFIILKFRTKSKLSLEGRFKNVSYMNSENDSGLKRKEIFPEVVERFNPLIQSAFKYSIPSIFTTSYISPSLVPLKHFSWKFIFCTTQSLEIPIRQ